MRAASVVKFLDGAHLSGYVEAPTMPERGGIMLLAGPGNLKTSMIRAAFSAYVPQALIVGDINVPTLNDLRESMAEGHLVTLALTAFEKIYERNPQTADNVEGHLKGFMDEGFSLPSYMSQQLLGQSTSRCLVVGALVNSTYETKHKKWKENGFSRRFIWLSFTLGEKSLLLDAIADQKRIKLEPPLYKRPESIKYQVTRIESDKLREMLRTQETPTTAFALLSKIYAALKWKYGAREAMDICYDVAQGFGLKKAVLTL